METTQTQKNKEERVKESEESLGELWDTAKELIHELLEFQKEERERREENLLKGKMVENLPNLGKKIWTSTFMKI